MWLMSPVESLLFVAVVAITGGYLSYVAGTEDPLFLMYTSGIGAPTSVVSCCGCP
jgi:hypothetical protein